MLRWLTGLLGGLILCATLAAWLVLGTGAGTTWLLGALAAVVPGELDVTNPAGSVLGGLYAEEVSYRSGATRVSIRDLRLHWRPGALARGRLLVDSIETTLVQVTLADAAKEQPDEPFVMTGIATPLPVTVARLEISELQLQAGEARETLRHIVLAARLEHSRLEVSELSGLFGALAVRLAGLATLAPPLPLALRMQWRLSDLGLGGSGALSGDLTSLAITQRLVGTGRLTGAVDLSGTIRDPLNDLQADLTATWESLAVSLGESGSSVAAAGRLRIDGRPTGWRARLDTRLRAAGWPEFAATATLEGDARLIHVRDLRLAGEPLAVTASGTVQPDGAPQLSLDIAVAHFNPAVLRRGLRGGLGAQMSVAATLPGHARLELRSLRGNFMDRPVSGAGTFEITGGVTTISGLRLRAGRNELTASGTVAERLAGRLALEAPELGVLWPGLGGALRAEARLGGSATRPQGRIELTGNGLSFDSSRVDALSLIASVDQAGRLAAKLQARNIGSGATALGELVATASGNLARHQLSLKLSGGVAEFEAQSVGGSDGQTLMHTVSPALFRAEPFGEWRLSGALRVSWRNGLLLLGDHCWLQEPASLCLRDGAWSGDRATLAAELRGLSLAPFGALLGRDLAIGGSVTANLAVRRGAEGVTGEFSWQQEGTTVRFTGVEDDPLTVSFPTVRVDVAATPDLAGMQAYLEGQAGIRLHASGTMRRVAAEAGELAGQVSGAVPDIAELITMLAPDWDLADVGGRIGLQAQVSGSASAPRVTGTVRLSAGAFTLPETGVRVEDIELKATGDDTATLVVTGTARSGGVLDLDGEVALRGDPLPSGFIRIRGRDVEALRLPDRYVQVSPDATLRYTGGRLRVEGIVDVPKADIVVRALPPSAASPSADTVVRDRAVQQSAPRAGPRVEGALQVSFGESVRLKAFGLETRLTGGLRLAQTPEGAAAAEGVLRLAEGKFAAYGQELTIDRGALIFNGPLDDPTFDVRASRRVEYEGRTVIAGLLLSGTAKRPESRVFAEPAMGEADALSYLVSGKPLSRASSADRSAMGAAALALGLRQTSPLTQQLGSAMALDELTVEGGNLDETAIVAGKQLNPDLYLRFAYGLFNRIGSVLARYRIGCGLSIEAASGEDQSLDLLWSAERD